MKYTIEITNQIVADYKAGKSVEDISSALSESLGESIPPRSIIAKLSSLGIYKKKEYLNKRGEVPIRKEEYIQRIAELLNLNIDLLESMEKVTKTALILIEKSLREKTSGSKKTAE